MFYIDSNTIEVKAAETLHYKRMRCYVQKKIGKARCTDQSCPICPLDIRKVKNLRNDIELFIADDNNLEKILRGRPEALLDINASFWTAMDGTYNYDTWHPYFEKKHLADDYTGPHKAGATNIKTHISQLKSIFNYTWFTDKENVYNAYKLTDNLARHTCTYCNRSYTSTVIRESDGQQIIRPTLDHWFFKAGHPLLGISFYNLVPSCYPCNSAAKGSKLLNLTDHTHPYKDANQTNDFEFGYFYRETADQYKIFLKTALGATDRSRDTLLQMHIEEIYNTHQSELTDLLLIEKNYPGSYIDSIKKMFNGKLTTQEIYRIAFGTEYDEGNFYKRPLSKFKSDVLKQMGIIKK